MELILNELYALQLEDGLSEDFKSGISTAISIVKKYKDYDDNEFLQSMIESALEWWSKKTIKEKWNLSINNIKDFQCLTDLEILDLYQKEQ